MPKFSGCGQGNSCEWPEDRLMAAMDAYLERDHDRALFGLPPRQKDEPG